MEDNRSNKINAKVSTQNLLSSKLFLWFVRRNQEQEFRNGCNYIISKLPQLYRGIYFLDNQIQCSLFFKTGVDGMDGTNGSDGTNKYKLGSRVL